MWLTWLADAARLTGYPVIEVTGWQSRGHGQMVACEGVVGHHTAGPATGNYPSLNTVVNGRPDLEGPLAHLGLARDGTIYVIAAGCAWHAGNSAWAGFTSLNDKFIGIEAESVGNGTDWTAAQLDAYPKLVGALLYTMQRGVDRYCAHRTCALPAGRKIDPTGIDDGWMRTQAQAVINTLTGPPATGSSQEDSSMNIDLVYAANGLDYRGLVGAECGSSSAVYARSFIKVSSAWGDTPVCKISALGANGQVIAQWTDSIPNNKWAVHELPSGTHNATVEGNRAASAVLVQASWLAIPY